MTSSGSSELSLILLRFSTLANLPSNSASLGFVPPGHFFLKTVSWPYAEVDAGKHYFLMACSNQCLRLSQHFLSDLIDYLWSYGWDNAVAAAAVTAILNL